MTNYSAITLFAVCGNIEKKYMEIVTDFLLATIVNDKILGRILYSW
jgi:hypothetical protein